MGVSVPKKLYVSVKARIDQDGFAVPLSVIWRDEREFPVERVLNVIPTLTAAGEEALGYTCMIRGQKRTVYHEQGRWYVIVQGKPFRQ